MNPRLPVRPFFTLSFVLLVCGSGLAGRAAAQVQYRTVALSGQAAPGTSAGVSYLFLGSSPILNDAGHVAYLAPLTGSGVTEANDSALYAAGPLAAPQLVARSGDVAPGMPAGVNYASLLNTPVLNNAGQVAYRASLTGSGVTGANDSAFYAGPLAAPQLMARDGAPAPGTPAGVTYSNLTSLVFNDAGQAGYHAILAGSGVTGVNNVALYAGTPAAPQLVARAGDTAPGTPAGVKYLSLSGGPALNDIGQVAYLATLTGSGVTNANDDALYAGPLAAPQLVARAGDAAPGTPAGVSYLDFEPPTFNDAGQVAFRAQLTGSGVTNANSTAMYAGSPAAPQLVARRGDVAPGTPPGVNYAGFAFSPVLNDAGQIAFRVTLSGTGVTSANDSAIYAGPLAAPQLVAREGDPAPGTPAGVVYGNFSLMAPTSPVINDAGQVAYFATLTGSGVTGANDGGLFAIDPALGELLIAREGDLFDVGGGDFRTIKDFGILFRDGRSDDEPSGLSNDGALAFRLGFTDDTSGIFTATIVPEPGALALLALAGPSLVGCRSTLRRRML